MLRQGTALLGALALSGCGGRTSIEDYLDTPDVTSGIRGGGGDSGSGGGSGGGNTGGGGAVGAGGSTGGTGATGGTGGSTGGTGGSTGGTGGSTPVDGNVFVDCETPILDGDGSSWTSPLRRLQDALWTREDGDAIFIKDGTCRPEPGIDVFLPAPSGLAVSIFGGYLGDPDDIYAHAGGQTLLTGDVNGNDVGLPFDDFGDEFRASRADNSRLVLQIDEGSDILLGNVTLSGAFDDSGDHEDSGCLSLGTNADLSFITGTIRDCTSVLSAAIYAAPSSELSLNKVDIEETLSLGGVGALSAYSADIELSNETTFSRNVAPFGGAIWLEASRLFASEVFFSNNDAYAEGGAIQVNETSSVELENVIFTSNTAANGAALANKGGTVRVRDCEFWNNAADGIGGDIYQTLDGYLEVRDSWFFGSSASNGGQIGSTNGDVFIYRSHFYGGNARSGGALWATGPSAGSPSLSVYDSSFVGATATADASTIASLGTHHSVRNSIFVQTGSPGVPVAAQFGRTGTYSNNEFRDNIGEGAIRAFNTQVDVIDSYIGGQVSQTSGALVADSSSILAARSVTLAENTTGGEASPAVTVGEGSTLDFDNSVVWSSAPANQPWFFVSPNGASATIDSSCGPASLSAFGSVALLSSSPFEDSGIHVPLYQSSSSPCLDQGNDTIAADWTPNFAMRSAVAPFALDTGPVDPGVHFASSVPLSRSLTVDPNVTSWFIPGNRDCHLTILSEGVSWFGSSNVVYAHTHPPGTQFIVTCFDEVLGTAPLVLVGQN